jgi:hypothetical protein
VDTTLPNITLHHTLLSLWPPNHKYQTINVSDFVSGASDSCDTTLSASAVIIESISSDEPENSNGGDGNTTNDMVIACNRKSAQLRSERDGNRNGRVYTLTLKVTDAIGNIRRVAVKVQVSHSQNGTNAVDDGAQSGYTITNASCP